MKYITNRLIIPHNRLSHCYTAGKIMERIAILNGEDEDTIHRYFLIGYLHDSCYDFEDNNEGFVHSDIVSQALNYLPYEYNDALKNHTKLKQNNDNLILDYLYIADALAGGDGYITTLEDRVFELTSRYGKESKFVLEQKKINNYLIEKGYFELIDKLINYFVPNIIDELDWLWEINNKKK